MMPTRTSPCLVLCLVSTVFASWLRGVNAVSTYDRLMTVLVDKKETLSSDTRKRSRHIEEDDNGGQKPGQRSFGVINESGKKLAVDWVNPISREMVTMTKELVNGDKVVFSSFVNHTFAVHESDDDAACHSPSFSSPSSSSSQRSGLSAPVPPGLQNNKECNVQFLTVGNDAEQVVVIRKGLQITHEENDSKPIYTEGNQVVRAALKGCKEQATGDLEAGYDAQFVMKELTQCLQEEATDILQRKSEEVTFEAEVRLKLSSLMENRTCADPNHETSTPIETRVWAHVDDVTAGSSDHGPDLVKREVLVLHDRQASQIHVLRNFISPEECQAIEEAAKPKLHRGTVADGSGGSRLSEARKAWQAGVKVPWKKENEGDPIARVARRIYDYTNDAVGYNLTVEGQEDLMSIQYFGIGKDSTEAPDQYMPHCDGDCDGLPHKHGGRVATMVMYCTVPELGGATNFQNSNVFVKPELGAAAFFSYMDPVTKEKETGFTMHSGCPVIEGTKRIAVQWMRIGVDAENPWNSFNTLTVKISDED